MSGPAPQEHWTGSPERWSRLQQFEADLGSHCSSLSLCLLICESGGLFCWPLRHFLTQTFDVFQCHSFPCPPWNPSPALQSCENVDPQTLAGSEINLSS